MCKTFKLLVALNVLTYTPYKRILFSFPNAFLSEFVKQSVANKRYIVVGHYKGKHSLCQRTTSKQAEQKAARPGCRSSQLKRVYRVTRSGFPLTPFFLASARDFPRDC